LGSKQKPSTNLGFALASLVLNRVSDMEWKLWAAAAIMLAAAYIDFYKRRKQT
jgi:hypothetical protein